MIENIIKLLKIKSIITKFGVIAFLLIISWLLIFLAGIVALLGIFWQNIK